MKLGVSVYPEKETISEIENYLQLASNYNFKSVFTSMFSVNEENDEVIRYFKNLSNIAHSYGMEVIGDCNSRFLNKMNASPSDLSVISEMGIDVLRMDGIYQDSRDIDLINNQYGIKVQLNASEMQAVESILKEGGDKDKITASYNFYPLRNTGASERDVVETNQFFTNLGIDTSIFISSNVLDAHGPWDVKDGLPTMEMHRGMDVSLQLRHIIAMGGTGEVIFGNAFASEGEFKAIKKVMDETYVKVIDKEGAFVGNMHFVPEGEITRIPLTIEVEDKISQIEKEELFVYDKHNVAEYNQIIFRSRWPRVIYGNNSIPTITNDREFFEQGDIIIINDYVPRYRGELHIVREKIKVEPYHNLVGHVIPEEKFLLKYLDSGKCFTFIQK